MKEETRKRSVVFILGTISALIGSVAILEFMRAEPWGLPDISPGGQFEIRFYEGFSPRKFLPTTPGNGGDNIDGFVALVERKSNRELKRKRVRYLRACEPKWTDDSVIFLGEADTIWELPRKDLP